VRAEAVFDPSQMLGADRSTKVDEHVRPREGDERLSENSRNDPRGAGGRDKPKKKPGPGGKPKSSNDVARALRSVYDKALRESVPPDFLDLLGKLD